MSQASTISEMVGEFDECRGVGSEWR